MRIIIPHIRPGAVTTLFCLILFLSIETIIASPAPKDVGERTTLKLAGRASLPPANKPLIALSQPDVRPREAHLAALLNGLNPPVTKMVTVTAPPATVLMTMLVTVTAPVPPAPTDPNTVAPPALPPSPPTQDAPPAPPAPPPPAAAAQANPEPAPAAPASGPVITLGFLGQQQAAPTSLPPPALAEPSIDLQQQAAVPVPQITPTLSEFLMPTMTVFGVLTETRTSIVTIPDEATALASVGAKATGVAGGIGGPAKSEAASGRQGSSFKGFGAVVIAVGVAVVIL